MLPFCFSPKNAHLIIYILSKRGYQHLFKSFPIY